MKGLGVGAHFKEVVNIPLVLNRLDRLAMTGLPIWVTSLSCSNTNVTARSAMLEDLLIAFYRLVLVILFV